MSHFGYQFLQNGQESRLLNGVEASPNVNLREVQLRPSSFSSVIATLIDHLQYTRRVIRQQSCLIRLQSRVYFIRSKDGGTK